MRPRRAFTGVLSLPAGPGDRPERGRKVPGPALDRTQPILPMTIGQAERGTHDYVRNGTTSLFAALNVATGQVIGKCYRRHRHQEFPKFLNEIDDAVPVEDGVTVHLVMA